MYRKIAVLSITLTTLAITSNSIASTALVVGAQAGYGASNPNTSNVQSNIKKGNYFYGGTVGIDFSIIPLLTIGAETGVFYGRSLSKISINSQGTTTVSNLIIPILAKAQISVPLSFNIFVKGGVSYVKPSATYTDSNISVSWKSDWNFTAATGIGYQIGHINLFAQYMRIFGKSKITINGENGTGSSARIDSITAGVTFTF
jgi:hypothetical protein